MTVVRKKTLYTYHELYIIPIPAGRVRRDTKFLDLREMFLGDLQDVRDIRYGHPYRLPSFLVHRAEGESGGLVSWSYGAS